MTKGGRIAIAGWILPPALLLATTALPQEPSPPPPAILTGRIEVVGRKGEKTPGTQAVVWIPGAPSSARSGATVASRNKRFTPHVLAVPRGASVSFPNFDRVYHNVFSLTPGNAFDLGLYRNGESKNVRFAQAGLVRVYCNIHPDMAAYIRVIEAAAFTVAQPDGTYRIDGIPPGRHLVRVWNEQGGETQIVAEFGPGQRKTLDFVLDASSYKNQPHKNKFGKDYPPVTRDVDRY
jgi:plastocyanin